jgi:hypothetical protein
MPTRKQRRRAEKDRRHDYEYETVWVDPVSGEEVEPPESAAVAEAPERRDVAKAKAKTAPQSGSRRGRVPQPPSWERAAKRSVILGAAIFALFYILGSKNGGHTLPTALLLGGVYTLLFIPFTYVVDRFSYNRYQRRSGEQPAKRPAKKR